MWALRAELRRESLAAARRPRTSLDCEPVLGVDALPEQKQAGNTRSFVCSSLRETVRHHSIESRAAVAGRNGIEDDFTGCRGLLFSGFRLFSLIIAGNHERLRFRQSHIRRKRSDQW